MEANGPRRSARRPVRAVLFDLDGVLVDSYEAWFRIVHQTAAAFGATEVTRERFESVWGQGISSDVKNLYPGRTHREVEEAYERAMAAHGSAVRVNPEAASVLADLGRRGIGRACVTNTQVSLARAILSGSGLASGFDEVQGMMEGIREKPAPDLLVNALDTLAARPADALMVGDSRYDEEAASAAGVPFLRFDLREGASLRRALAERLMP
jgi:HAD superfamily hydrolase (TIGR01509 family)